MRERKKRNKRWGGVSVVISIVKCLGITGGSRESLGAFDEDGLVVEEDGAEEGRHEELWEELEENLLLDRTLMKEEV